MSDALPRQTTKSRGRLLRLFQRILMVGLGAAVLAIVIFNVVSRPRVTSGSLGPQPWKDDGLWARPVSLSAVAIDARESLRRLLDSAGGDLDAASSHDWRGPLRITAEVRAAPLEAMLEFWQLSMETELEIEARGDAMVVVADAFADDPFAYRENYGVFRAPEFLPPFADGDWDAYFATSWVRPLEMTEVHSDGDWLAQGRAARLRRLDLLSRHLHQAASLNWTPGDRPQERLDALLTSDSDRALKEILARPVNVDWSCTIGELAERLASEYRIQVAAARQGADRRRILLASGITLRGAIEETLRVRGYDFYCRGGVLFILPADLLPERSQLHFVGDLPDTNQLSSLIEIKDPLADVQLLGDWLVARGVRQVHSRLQGLLHGIRRADQGLDSRLDDRVLGCLAQEVGFSIEELRLEEIAALLQQDVLRDHRVILDVNAWAENLRFTYDGGVRPLRDHLTQLLRREGLGIAATENAVWIVGREDRRETTPLAVYAARPWWQDTRRDEQLFDVSFLLAHSGVELDLELHASHLIVQGGLEDHSWFSEFVDAMDAIQREPPGALRRVRMRRPGPEPVFLTIQRDPALPRQPRPTTVPDSKPRWILGEFLITGVRAND